MRGPWGILLIVAVVVVAIVVALATIPVDHSLHHSTTAPSSSGTYRPIDVWSWSFPSGTHVTVTWTGPAGTNTNLTVLGVLGPLLNLSGQSGTIGFTAVPFPYVFEASVYNPGTGPVSVDFTASYRAPIL